MLLEIIIIIFGILAFLTLITIGWGISTYNFYQSIKQDIENMLSNIYTEYQRRYDLFMNLAKTVKSYKDHEYGVMTKIAEARSQLQKEPELNKKVKIMKKIDTMFSGMKIQFEAYPDLKANTIHTDLMNEIRITEDRVNIARTSMNDIINEYNSKIKVFPSNIVANMFGFKIISYYEGDRTRATNNAPEINI